MSKFPILGLHSPPDSNAQKDNESDSELSDLEMEVSSLSEAKTKLEPDHMRDGVPVFTPNMAQFHDFEKCELNYLPSIHSLKISNYLTNRPQL